MIKISHRLILLTVVATQFSALPLCLLSYTNASSSIAPSNSCSHMYISLIHCMLLRPLEEKSILNTTCTAHSIATHLATPAEMYCFKSKCQLGRQLVQSAVHSRASCVGRIDSIVLCFDRTDLFGAHSLIPDCLFCHR